MRVILKGTVERTPLLCDSFTSFVSFVEFNLILVAVDNRSGIRYVCVYVSANLVSVLSLKATENPCFTFMFNQLFSLNNCGGLSDT